jgi:tRNA-Thr(GGU) m(6)t(6)A37 methyltransferase TsaA
MNDIIYTPIGLFSTPHIEVKGMPIQSSGAEGIQGSILIYDQFKDGLLDLDGFSHIFVLYHLHQIHGYSLSVTPFLDQSEHGIFATRSPKRPNPIGLSLLKLIGVEGNKLSLENVDVLDGTPVLDIKPYVKDFDYCETASYGWFTGKSHRGSEVKADERFI